MAAGIVAAYANSGPRIAQDVTNKTTVLEKIAEHTRMTIADHGAVSAIGKPE